MLQFLARDCKVNTLDCKASVCSSSCLRLVILIAPTAKRKFCACPPIPPSKCTAHGSYCRTQGIVHYKLILMYVHHIRPHHRTYVSCNIVKPVACAWLAAAGHRLAYRAGLIQGELDSDGGVEWRHWPHAWRKARG